MAARRGGTKGQSYTELIRRIESGQLDPVIVLDGGEQFLVDRSLEKLEKAAVGSGPVDFNRDLLHGSSAEMAQLLNAARTPPMMSSRRLVLVKEADKIGWNDSPAFEAYVVDPLPTTCLVLVVAKLDRRLRISKLLLRHATVVDCAPPRQLTDFLSDAARRRGKSLAFEAGTLLAELVGRDLAALDQAIEQLSLFVGAEDRIESDHVEQAIADTRTQEVFALSDSVAVGDLPGSLATVRRILRGSSRGSEIALIALLGRHFRQLLLTRELLDQRADQGAVAAAVKVPPFVARRLMDQARHLQADDLVRGIDVLLRADRQVKSSGRLDAHATMDWLVLQLTTGSRATSARRAPGLQTHEGRRGPPN